MGATFSRSLPAARVLGATVARGALATTGNAVDPLDLTVVALGLVLAGRVLVRRSRKT